jgi:hypothetical protein
MAKDAPSFALSFLIANEHRSRDRKGGRERSAEA